MERRDFIHKAGLLAAFGTMMTQDALALTAGPKAEKGVEPRLFPALPALDHKGGMDIRVWVRSEMTAGVYSNVECAVAPKTMGPPPHWHHELDELMYVVEGTANILIGDDVVEVAAGGWHLRPRGIKHTFWNASDQALRFYDMYFHQAFELYLEKIFHEYTNENGYTDGSEKKNQAIDELNKKYGLVFPADSFSQRDSIVKQYGLR